jgi:hypothetical protein
MKRIAGRAVIREVLLLQTEAALLNNMQKPAGKAVKTAMAGNRAATTKAVAASRVPLGAGLPSSMQKQEAKATRINKYF